MIFLNFKTSIYYIKMIINRIISGGQTGVDQGALEFALHYQIPCGGFCPKGRSCESGKIPNHFPMTETKSRLYSHRTKANVEISDASLILINDNNIGQGTALTINLCNQLNRPYLILEMDKNHIKSKYLFSDWIISNCIRTLNIAGNRESQNKGIQQLTFNYLKWLTL